MTTDQANTNDAVMPLRLMPEVAGPVLLVCEHASNYIPDRFDRLGVTHQVARSHIAWDPGAMGVARSIAEQLDAPLIAAQASRLCFDCNRPPGAWDAVPPRSEIFEVPGNQGLSAADLAERAKLFYAPFRAALAETIDQAAGPPAIVTIHSFTPVYRGVQRTVEIGILHDDDARLADAMLAQARNFTKAQVQRNAPYGPQEGVTHTLREHALPRGLLNVMLEIRNDLIETLPQQEEMAQMLVRWLCAALRDLGVDCARQEMS